jgi:serine/threonine protein kinase
MPWSAPEVLASMSTGGSGVVATTATDMYQFGGTLHEIMTCGDAPFWWLLEHPTILVQRRRSRDPIRIPGSRFSLPGLLGKNTLQAAALDSEPVTWRVRVEEGNEGSACRLRELVEILEGCLEEDPDKRWKGNALYVRMVGWALCRKLLCGVPLVSAALLNEA